MTTVEPAAPLAIGTLGVRVPVLDGLRSSFILVMFTHFRSVGEPAADAWAQRVWHDAVIGPAAIALDIFFVLSGFLITGILLDTKGSPSYLRRFYARRALRILPVYYGFLLVYFVMLPAVADWAHDLALTPFQHLFYWTYLMNIGLGLNTLWDPALAGMAYPLHPSTGHLWSLAVEEQFYLVWPIIVLVCSRRGLRITCLSLLAIAPLVRLLLVATLRPESFSASVLTPARMDGLAFGGLMAVLAAEGRGLELLSRWARPVAGIAAATLVAVVALERMLGIQEGALYQMLGLTASTYVAGSLVVIVVSAKETDLWHRMFASRPLRELGRYSYAGYVLHVPLMFSLESSGVFGRPVSASGFAAEVGYSMLMVPLSIGAAALSWHLLEKHVLQLRRHLPYEPSGEPHTPDSRR